MGNNKMIKKNIFKDTNAMTRNHSKVFLWKISFQEFSQVKTPFWSLLSVFRTVFILFNFCIFFTFLFVSWKFSTVNWTHYGERVQSWAASGRNPRMMTTSRKPISGPGRTWGFFGIGSECGLNLTKTDQIKSHPQNKHSRNLPSLLIQ